MANITNRPHKNEISRIITGFSSMDRAFEDNFGNYGVPSRTIFEICGDKGVGKSTFMFYLGGLIAEQLKKNITLVDFEGQNYITVDTCLDLSGFTGEVDWKTYEWLKDGNKKAKGKKARGEMTVDEDMLTYAVNKLYESPPSVIMIDSLAGFTPTAMHENDVNAGNMGVTAKPIKTFLRQCLKPILGNPEPSAIFFTNHKYPIIGGFKPGPNAPTPTEHAGGKAVGYFATESVEMSKLYGFAYTDFGGYVLQGKVAKNRVGYGIESKKSFYVYLQAGEGLNKNLTAVIDCVMYGLANSSSNNLNDSSTVTLDGQNMGKFRDMIVARHDPSIFEPFHNSLKAVTGGIKEVSTTLGEQ